MADANSMFVNEAAEKQIIGLISTDSSFSDITVQLMEDDFAVPDYKAIFGVMKKMYASKTPIDFVTLNAEFDKAFDKETAKRLMMLVMQLANDTLMAKYHLKQYIALIQQASIRRKLLGILDSSKKRLTETSDDTTAILEKTRQELRDVVTTNHSWKSMTDVLLATFETLERRAKGEETTIPSGLACLDANTTGFHRGELTVIGARPAVGKSAFGAHIALAAAERGYKVGICSREMTDVQYGTRILSRDADIDNHHLRTGDLKPEEWESISHALQVNAPLNVGFMFTARYIEDLRMEVQKKVDAGDLDILMVDYLQLMQSRQKFDGDWLRIGYVSKMLKDMTVDFNIAVVALAQVGRSVENTMPTLADLRGSGDIEQDADNVIFLHRPRDTDDKYVRPGDKAIFDQIVNSGLQYIAVNIAKQRQGEIGTMAVVFDPSRMRYTPIERGT